jgi:hypothetical protein
MENLFAVKPLRANWLSMTSLRRRMTEDMQVSPCPFECVARLVEIAGGARFEKPSVHAALIRGQRVGDIRAFRPGSRDAEFPELAARRHNFTCQHC